MLKTIFFGTPETAVPFLDALARKTSVAMAVSAPDKPAGRGYALTPPPVKTSALALGLPVLQPASLRDGSFSDALAAIGPVDVGVVVAYGRLLPPSVFNFPRHGLMNVHFSLLPRYRGAAPVQWALMRGETETGVTLFRIEAGLDTGPVYSQARAPVERADTSDVLRARLAARGLSLLDEFLAAVEKGTLTAVPQEGTPSLAPSLKKEDGRIGWARDTAEAVYNRLRGVYEWPGAFCSWRGENLRIRWGEPVPWAGNELPGSVVSEEKGKGFLIKCRTDAFLALRVQPEGKKEQDAWSFRNGARLKIGDFLQ